MKTILQGIFLLTISLPIYGQEGKLFGTRTKETNSAFSSLNVSEAIYKEIVVYKKSYTSYAGQTTFDDTKSRYFLKNGSTIFIINALDGTLLDSILNVSSFYNFEYDKSINSLVGIQMIQTSLTFKTYNLSTKEWSTKGGLPLVKSVVLGESTFDPINRRYFTFTNIGVVVVDSNGIYADVLCSSPYLFGIEYDENANKVCYFEDFGEYTDFVAIEANTCVGGALATYLGYSKAIMGESTFDKNLGHYFNRTNQGLLQVDALTGEILKNFSSGYNIFGMEFSDVASTQIKEEKMLMGKTVFPNPSNGTFNFSPVKSGSTIKVFNFEGRLIFESTVEKESLALDFEAQPRGIYFYRIYTFNEEVQQGKLILR